MRLADRRQGESSDEVHTIEARGYQETLKALGVDPRSVVFRRAYVLGYGMIASPRASRGRRPAHLPELERDSPDARRVGRRCQEGLAVVGWQAGSPPNRSRPDTAHRRTGKGGVPTGTTDRGQGREVNDVLWKPCPTSRALPRLYG